MLLRDVAKKFVGVGLCESAVKAYLRDGDVKAAIDSCVVLNQWDKAVELAERHNFQQIEALLGKYAGHLLEGQQVIGAIDLFRKANKHTEVASLLTRLAKSVAASKGPVLRAKKLHVLAALEATKVPSQSSSFRNAECDAGVEKKRKDSCCTDLRWFDDTGPSGERKFCHRGWLARCRSLSFFAARTSSTI